MEFKGQERADEGEEWGGGSRRGRDTFWMPTGEEEPAAAF